MSDAPPTPLPGRAREARENDAALFRAARAVFAERGYDAPIAAIAERAGVGVASVYRRYRSKDELVERLRAQALRDVIDEAVWALQPDEGDESGAVARFLRRHLAAAESASSTSLTSRVALTPELAELSRTLREALDRLIAADQRAGLVPAGYTAADVMVALVHLRPTLPGSLDQARELRLRQLEYHLRGLRASVTDPASAGSGLDWDAWMALNVLSS